MKREKTMRTKKNSLLWVEEIFPLVGEKIIPCLGQNEIPFLGGKFPVVGFNNSSFEFRFVLFTTLMVKVVHENKRLLLFEHRRMCPQLWAI